MIWLIWDKCVDTSFRPDFKTLVGQDIPRNPVETMGRSFAHRVEGLNRDQMDKLGALYSKYLTFKVNL